VPPILTNEWWRTFRSNKYDKDNSSRDLDDTVVKRDFNNGATVAISASINESPNSNSTNTEECHAVGGVSNNDSIEINIDGETTYSKT
jgi:hypothetical protein